MFNDLKLFSHFRVVLVSVSVSVSVGLEEGVWGLDRREMVHLGFQLCYMVRQIPVLSISGVIVELNHSREHLYDCVVGERETRMGEDEEDKSKRYVNKESGVEREHIGIFFGVWIWKKFTGLFPAFGPCKSLPQCPQGLPQCSLRSRAMTLPGLPSGYRLGVQALTHS